MFTKITNQLYYGLNGDNEKSILKIIKDAKVLLVLDYLYTNRTINNVSLYTLDDMAYYYGYVPRSGCNKKTNDLYINQQFQNILLELDKLGIIKLIVNDKNNKKYKLINRCEILIDLGSKYFTLEEQVKNKILQYKPNGKKVDNTKLLLFYCYILSKIYIRADNYKDINMGGKTEVCYPSYKIIKSNINISENSVNKYNKILIDLDLIRIANAGRFYYRDDKEKQIHESANTYTLYRKDEKHNTHLKRAIQSYKLDSSRIFIDKERCDKKARQDNGFIGNIDKLEKLGKAKPEFIEKRDRLVQEREEKKRKKKIVDSS